MKQINYKFVDIVSLLFLLVLLFSNFLAFLYITKGNFVFSFIISFFIAILYFFIVQKMRDNKEAMVRQNYKHSSIIFIVFFTVLSFVSFISMSHFLNVEFKAKTQIQNETKQKIQLLEDLVATYNTRSKEDIQNYESNLSTLLSQYKKNPNKKLRDSLEESPYNFSNTLLNNRSEINIPEVIKAVITPLQTKVDGNKKYLKDNISENNEKFAKVFQNWQRLSVMNTYSNLNSYMDENVKRVNEKLAELPLNKEPIQVKFNTNQLPLDSPTQLAKIYKPNYTFTFIIILLIHLGILLAFILDKTRVGTKIQLSEQAQKLVREID